MDFVIVDFVHSAKNLCQTLNPSIKINMEYQLQVEGEAGVGKSALTIQYIQNQFVEDYDPTIEDYYRKQITLKNGDVCLLDILDTGSQHEEYAAMREYYPRSAQGYLIMYSVTSRSTFEEVPLKYKSILRVKDTSHYPVVLVGNKIDAEGARQVSQLEGLRLAGLMGCPFFETSAKSRVNVEEVFLELVNEIRRMLEPEIQVKQSK